LEHPGIDLGDQSRDQDHPKEAGHGGKKERG
jgi:hypothetical protein